MIFAFNLDVSDGNSFLDFGDYDTSSMDDPADLTWLEAPDTFFWQGWNEAVRFG